MSEPRGAAASSDSGAGLIAQVESLRKTRPDQAWALLARQFPVALRGASALRRGELWRLRGHLQRSLSRWSAAAQAYRRAEDWFRRAGDLREQGRCAIGLVDTLMYLGRYGEAERVAARGRRALARVGDPHAQARLLNNEGNLHHRLDRPDRALERYRKARSFLARAGDRRGSRMVDGNIANCLSLLGRTPEARRLYRGARRASLAGGFEVEALNADYNLAYLDFLEHRHERALDGLERVREVARRQGVAQVVALTSLDRAEILLRLGDHDGAFEEAHTATTAFRELGMDYERAKAEVFASLAQFRLGRPAAARSGLERALADFQSEGNAVWVGEALIGLATSWWSQGSAAAAAPLLAAAAGRFAWAKDREREGAALALLAQARLESGARGAAATLARARRVAGRRPSPRLEHLLLVAAAEAARRDGDRAAARRHLTRAARASERLAAGILDEQWRASFWGEWSIPHRELAALEMDADRPEAAFEALERGRGRVLASAWRRTRSPRALRGWAASRLARDRDRGTRSGSPGAMVAEVAPPATLRRALSSSIAPSFRARDVGDRLADGAALLDFAFHRGALSAFVVRRTGIEMRPCLVAERELARISHDVLFELRRAALEPREQRAASPALAAALEELASLVLWPLLERGTPDRLAVVPSGPLGRIPWAALPLPDGQPLCAAASLTLVPGLRLGLASRAPRQGSNAPALIVAVESEGLESVMREAEALRRALPDAVLLSGPEATAERFLELAPKAGWIHFAGHGVHESGRSGLRLHDRWLLAEEMDGLRLAARGVALSACQTARALVQPGEEWFGFPRNLLLAGAGAVLAAQWDVDDASAARLMGDVYGRLASGERVGPAVSGAQAALAANGVHPLDWAGFVILGGPGAGDASPEGVRAAAGAC
jgi:tetratricopeptide (TPR) repeat protein